MGHSKEVSLEPWVCILKGQKNTNKQPNVTSQTPRKARARKIKNKQERNNKIRAEINEIENKNNKKQRINKWNKKLLLWKK
jgi:hypothetical protein